MKRKMLSADVPVFESTQYVPTESDDRNAKPVDVPSLEASSKWRDEEDVDTEDLLALMAAKLNETIGGDKDFRVVNKKLMNQRQIDLDSDLVVDTKNATDSVKSKIAESKVFAMVESNRLDARETLTPDNSRQKRQSGSEGEVVKIEVDLGLESSSENEADLTAVLDDGDQDAFSVLDSVDVHQYFGLSDLAVKNSETCETVASKDVPSKGLVEEDPEISKFVANLFLSDANSAEAHDFVICDEAAASDGQSSRGCQDETSVGTQDDESINSFGHKSSLYTTDENSLADAAEIQSTSSFARNETPEALRSNIDSPGGDLTDAKNPIDLYMLKSDTVSEDERNAIAKEAEFGGFGDTDVDTSTLQPVRTNSTNGQAKMANILSTTLWLNENPNAAFDFHPSDILIDHMTQLYCELKIFQFHQDGYERAIKVQSELFSLTSMISPSYCCCFSCTVASTDIWKCHQAGLTKHIMLGQLTFLLPPEPYTSSNSVSFFFTLRKFNCSSSFISFQPVKEPTRSTTFFLWMKYH